MSGTFTSDGNSEIIFASIVGVMYSGGLDGGTLTLKRLKAGGDEDNAAHWITVQDSAKAASYTVAASGDSFDLGGPTKVRLNLTGSTTPATEYHLRGRMA